MPSYFVNNGIKQEIDDDLFDLMSSMLEKEQSRFSSSSSTTSSEEEPTSWRRKSDGTYDNRPSDPDYFKKYYERKVKQPVQCKYCGTMMSDKSNLSKHYKTKKCINSRV